MTIPIQQSANVGGKTRKQKALYTIYFLTLVTSGDIFCYIAVKQMRPDKQIDSIYKIASVTDLLYF